jgi:hypothetical protein
LANLFLHYVLDEWFEKEIRPRLQGEAFMIRYADDFVIGVARGRKTRIARPTLLRVTESRTRPAKPFRR